MAGKEISEIYCWKLESDRLDIFMASSKKGATRVGLELGKGTGCLDFFRMLFPTSRLIRDESRNQPLLKAIKRVLEGGRLSEELPLDIESTSFQGMVWKAISRIPFGEKRTYGEVATIIGRPGGARAVGQAMHRNPLPLIYP